VGGVRAGENARVPVWLCACGGWGRGVLPGELGSVPLPWAHSGWCPGRPLQGWPGRCSACGGAHRRAAAAAAAPPRLAPAPCKHAPPGFCPKPQASAQAVAQGTGHAPPHPPQPSRPSRPTAAPHCRDPPTSGLRYCRVWMSSVKCLCVQQALPKSTSLQRALGRSSSASTRASYCSGGAGRGAEGPAAVEGAGAAAGASAAAEGAASPLVAAPLASTAASGCCCCLPEGSLAAESSGCSSAPADAAGAAGANGAGSAADSGSWPPAPASASSSSSSSPSCRGAASTGLASGWGSRAARAWIRQSCRAAAGRGRCRTRNALQAAANGRGSCAKIRAAPTCAPVFLAFRLAFFFWFLVGAAPAAAVAAAAAAAAAAVHAAAAAAAALPAASPAP
jgi:hypothetical protein